MARKSHTEGFTVAELLTVVAILAVLAALVGVSLFNYFRNLTLTEYDNAAKSIYIAAQNNIADLQASGEWAANAAPGTAGTTGSSSSTSSTTTGTTGSSSGTSSTTGTTGSSSGTSSTTGTTGTVGTVGSSTSGYFTQKRASGNLEKKGLYFITADDAQRNSILPAGTIDTEVWSNSYIIEYDYATATVYGVFYTEDAQAALTSYYNLGAGARDRDERRAQSMLVGYYGGDEAANLSRIKLVNPIVSAGRSSTLAVTDGNLAATGLQAANRAAIRTQVTITNQTSADQADQAGQTGQQSGASVTLVLQSNGPGIDPTVSYIIPGQAPIQLNGAIFCNLSGARGTTYSLNLTEMKNNSQLASVMEQFQAGDEYSVVAKSMSTAQLCRPAYGYGTGIWPSADDLIFTSNVLADYETQMSDAAETTDLYVYRSQNDGNVSEPISLNLENWYNSTTFANEDLYYRFGNDSRLEIQSVRDSDGDAVRQILPGLYQYTFLHISNIPQQDAHTVTFRVVGANGLTDGTTVPLRVQAYRGSAISENAITGEPGKTLTINIHVVNAQRTFDYRVEDRGSYYEVFLLAGETQVSGVNIICNAKAVPDYSNSNLRVSGNMATYTQVLGAGGSTSVRFLKTDTNDTLREDSFSVTATQG